MSTWDAHIMRTKRKILFFRSPEKISWWARVDYASRAYDKEPGLRLPASASLPLASCWPRPQPRLPVSATGGGRLRCCSNPPAIVSLTLIQKKTASVSLHQRFFHGRGWITQAALLKTAHWAVFALSSATAPQLFESTRQCESNIYAKENRQCISTPAVFSWARVDSNHRS